MTLAYGKRRFSMKILCFVIMSIITVKTAIVKQGGV